MEVSTHYLSQAINENSNKNFYEFINSYRINSLLVAFQKNNLHATGKTQTNVTEMAFEHGFNSKSAFYKAFKMQTGMPPSQYLKHKEEEN